VIHGRRAFDHEAFLKRPLFAHLASVTAGEPHAAFACRKDSTIQERETGWTR